MIGMRRLSLAFGIATASLALAQGTQRTFDRPERLTRIQDNVVNESSGLGASRLFPGEFYTHNDSGDGPRFFRFNSEGRVTGTWTLKGARAVDWEDMEVATVGGRPMVYLADIGDNNRRRDEVVIYRFEEPRGGSGEIERFDTIRLRYPGGARDAEAFLVDPRTGDLWIVEKRQGKGDIFTLRAPRGSGKFTMRRAGSIEFPDGPAPLRLITGGSVAPDGRYLVLRTYAFAYEFPVPGRTFEKWLTTRPTRINVPLEVQGEAITYTADGKALLTSSEGNQAPIGFIRIRP